MQRIKQLEKLPLNASYDCIDSPIGQLTIITSPDGLHCILWEEEAKNTPYKELLGRLQKDSINEVTVKVKRQLTEYFNGKRKQFDLPLCFVGTDFQLKAWQELYKIPFGTTVSYGEQAKRVGDKNKARAVGAANGCNPIPVIVPCHRVIGANGKLTGFGGGLGKKRKLLELEGVI